MSELKQIEPISAWIEYDLDTKQIDPPILKLRLKYLEDSDIFAAKGDNPLTPLERYNKMIDLIVEWDVTQGGQPLPLTDKFGRNLLMNLLTRNVPSRGMLLNIAVIQDAQDRESFLKN